MKITIESTDKIVKFAAGRGQKPYEARVWVGKTESGIKLSCLIPRIAVDEKDDQAQFERELLARPAPQPVDANTSAFRTAEAFPAKMVI